MKEDEDDKQVKESYGQDNDNEDDGIRPIFKIDEADV